MFEVLPAIDLRGGRVIRLQEGDFSRETAYGDDPVSVAKGFMGAGATWLHVVDLDGARAGEPRQLPLVGAITSALGEQVRIELGGGLRTPEAVRDALAIGITRVAVGTAALRSPIFAAQLVARHGADRIVASVDVRGGMALGDAWRPATPGLPAAEAIAMLAAAGITTFEVTAIDRDGLLGGPDLALLGSLVGLGRGRIIASGGIASLDDVLAARDAGCAGAIVGRALYEGQIELGSLIVRLAERGGSA